MKTINFFLALQILFILFNCSSDEQADSFEYDGTLNLLGFSTRSLNLEEGGEAVTIQLNFKKPTKIDGTVTIRASDLESLEVSGATVNEHSEIVLNFDANTTNLSFAIKRINDSKISENTDPVFTLKNITGPHYIDTNNKRLDLDISDDELHGYLKSYEILRGNDRITKKIFFYDESKRIAEIKNVSISGSDYSTTSEFYNYNDEGKIIEEISGNNKIIYNWANDRIESSVKNGSTQNFYGYNSEGELISRLSKSYIDGFEAINDSSYDYYDDGNIAEIIDSFSGVGFAGWDTIPTQYLHTYKIEFTDYINQTNPFPELQILPNQIMQPNLPTTVIKYEYVNGSYSETERTLFNYVFDDEGKLLRKITANYTVTYRYN